VWSLRLDMVADAESGGAVSARGGEHEQMVDGFDNGATRPLAHSLRG
jgi:hypothetical protein